MNLQRQNSTKPRDPRDFYPTPRGFIRSALGVLDDYLLYPPQSILDPGAGRGVWGMEARMKWNGAFIVGIDDYFDYPESIDAKAWSYDTWRKENFLKYNAPNTYDLITGNPPYGMAEPFIRQSIRYLKGGGICAFLLRLEFVAGQKRAGTKRGQKVPGLWEEYPLRALHIIPRRISFTGDGKTDAFEYAFFVWQKGYKGITTMHWLDWDYLPEDMWARNGVRGHTDNMELPPGLESSSPACEEESRSQSDDDGVVTQDAPFVPTTSGARL